MFNAFNSPIGTKTCQQVWHDSEDDCVHFSSLSQEKMLNLKMGSYFGIIILGFSMLLHVKGATTNVKSSALFATHGLRRKKTLNHNECMQNCCAKM